MAALDPAPIPSTRRRSASPWKGAVAIAALAIVSAACSSSSEQADSFTTTTGANGNGSETVDTGSTTTRSGDTSDPATTEPTGDADPAGGSDADPAAESTDGPPDAGDDVLRLAPAGGDELVLLWDNEAAWAIGHTGERSKIADGPFAEVTDLPGYGLVFQREERESTIWLADADGVRDLIVGADDQMLTLEGTGVSNADESPVVYYQRHESGDIETSRTTLRRFELFSGDVTELLETGGWEAGTVFSHISGDRLTVAATGAEAFVGNLAIDLSTTPPSTSVHDDDFCIDGDDECDFYQRVAVVGALSGSPRTVGIAPISNDGVRDGWGLWEFDFGGDESRLIASWPWDDGEWYVEDMFALSGTEVLLSLSDWPGTGGNPLPALIVDIDSGEARTLPAAMFARPIWLS